MSLENAQQFVTAMREEHTYRQAACKAAADEQLTVFLHDHGYNFDLHHLVIAMAGCMEEMARSCGEKT